VNADARREHASGTKYIRKTFKVGKHGTATRTKWKKTAQIIREKEKLPTPRKGRRIAEGGVLCLIPKVTERT